MALLGLNIDHVATVRQARRGIEPDPVDAAIAAIEAGADCITVHLREDRRHIQDTDVGRVRAVVRTKLNLEMAATDEMLRIAARIRPEMATLVPEGRLEVTTEGGLDVFAQRDSLRDSVKRLEDAGILPSAFIDPHPRQVEAAAECGFDVCEIHTGEYARVYDDQKRRALELMRIADAGTLIRSVGMKFNAGHALNYKNVREIATLEGVWELHIGHSIVSRALFVGIGRATREMKALICGS